MMRKAAKFREMIGAAAVISGEVLGQRPMSQQRHHLELNERESGLEGRLLRPLCAKRLPPTIPEREGIIDRSRLYSFAGRRRTELTDLAKELGLSGLVGTSPGAGCALTEPEFAPRIRDLWAHQETFFHRRLPAARIRAALPLSRRGEGDLRTRRSGKHRFASFLPSRKRPRTPMSSRRFLFPHRPVWFSIPGRMRQSAARRD